MANFKDYSSILTHKTSFGDIVIPTLGIGIFSVFVISAGFFIMNLSQKRAIVGNIRKTRRRLKDKFVQLETRLKDSDGVLMTAERLAIRNLTFSELRDGLQKGLVTAVEVLEAYQACALAVTGRTNCVVDFIEEAQEWAAALDNLGPGKGGPLHGIPISVKENISISGYDSTYGIGKRLSMPVKDDAVLITVLKKLGAVPFCRTNIPQTMISFGSGNPIYGRTENPYQSGRSAGGSSSGEGCLVGAGGSIVGLAADIGGSVRIPAAFSGCASLKPTVGRLSGLGFLEPLNGICGLSATPGFMARSSDALALVFGEISKNPVQRKLDPALPDLQPISGAMGNTKKLRIGVYDDDGYFLPTPGLRRAVKIAKAALENEGHEIVPFAVPDGLRAFKLYTDIIKADGMENLLEAMKGEPVDPSVKMNTIAARTPAFLKCLLGPVISMISAKTALLLKGGALKSADLWNCVHEASEYKKHFLDKWSEAGIDVILCPAFGVPAPPHESCSFLLTAACYTTLYNLLDFPAGIVPVTLESEQDQVDLKAYPSDGDKMHADTKAATKGATGLPLSVQIVGLPWMESVVLTAMKELEDGLKQAHAAQFLHSTEPWNASFSGSGQVV